MARQLTMFKFNVGTCEMVQAEDGRYDMVKNVMAMIEATSLTKTEIRAAIEEAQGAKLKRGVEVFADKVGKVQYRFSTEALMSIADERIELPLD